MAPAPLTMSDTIAIKFNDNGRITNRYIGAKSESEWTSTQRSEWPDADPADDEIAQYYYDESDGSITVQYKTVPSPDEPLS